MRIEITQPEYKTRAVVEEEGDDFTLDEVLEKLVKLALMAVGYPPSLVERIGIRDEEEKKTG